MKKMYEYTLFKQDGTKEQWVENKLEIKTIYEVLKCSLIEIIPSAYYEGLGFGKCTVYGDEEGRFNTDNVRNPFFNVLTDENGGQWDVVGNILKEEIHHEHV